MKSENFNYSLGIMREIDDREQKLSKISSVENIIDMTRQKNVESKTTTSII